MSLTFLCGFSVAMRRVKRGRRYAKVFPVPVSLWNIMFRPSATRGIAFAWTAVGSVIESSFNLSIRFWLMLKSEKFMGLV